MTPPAGVRKTRRREVHSRRKVRYTKAMNRALPLALVFASSALAYSACGDDDPSPSTGGSLDASLDLNQPTAEAGAPDTAVADSGGPPDAASADSGADANTLDAAGDATNDAGAADASDASDAATAPTLYAHFQGSLYRVNPSTAALTLVGATGHTDVRLAWNPVRGGLFAVVEALTAPKLATVDRCTGAITVGPRVTKAPTGGGDAGLLKRMECFAANPITGEFYASGDWVDSATTVTGSLVKVDFDASAASRLGSHQTLQDDGDSCSFRGGTLYMMDVMQTTPTTGSSAIYTMNLADAAATLAITTTPRITRIGVESTLDTIFAINGTDKTLMRLEFDAGTSLIGSFGFDAATTAADLDSLVAAPEPAVCP